tara:strand:+ start:5 stop:1324 length:1320 start_codon:yes stop_codon:yes gene_type:complete
MITLRRFSGYTGIAIKNSIYQFSTTLISKIGSLIFIVILARLLMPELFGLYSLALSTILLFASFADLGIDVTLVRFISNSLGKNNKKKAKRYLVYLTKIKFIFVLITSFSLIILAKLLADNYYHKPIFLALIAGGTYIFMLSFVNFIESILHSVNKFKWPLFRELFFQIIRFLLVPLIVLISLKYSVSNEINLFLIFSTLSFCYFLALIFIYLITRRKISFLKVKSEKIKRAEKKEVKKFIFPLSTMILSGIFFLYVDMVMLGRFVLAEFLSYYRVAFSLIASITPLIAFSVVLFPIFSRIKGKRLERALKKSIRITLLLSLTAALATLILAPIVVRIIFGKDYLTAVPILRLLSLLLISGPLTAIYSDYIIARGKPGIVAKLLITSTILNITLNYFLIVWLLNYGNLMAVFGATFATLISRYLYLGGLIIFKNKTSKK